jgi:predicted nucleotidyltransferase
VRRNTTKPKRRGRALKSLLILGSLDRGAKGAASDLDLLALGTVSEPKLNAALKPVGRKLGRAVHATACSMESFRSRLRAGESFAVGIAPGPRVALIGDLDAAIFQATGQ